MKPIILTHHASIRVAENAFPINWVERAVRDPEWVEPEPTDVELERRYKSIAELDGRVLRVVVAETSRSIRVISVFPDRGARRRHARQQPRP